MEKPRRVKKVKKTKKTKRLKYVQPNQLPTFSQSGFSQMDVDLEDEEQGLMARPLNRDIRSR